MKKLEINKIKNIDSKRLADAYKQKLAKQKRGIEFFKYLVEDVDYKKEKTNIDAPLEVFKIVPISEKGVKYFKGEY